MRAPSNLSRGSVGLNMTPMIDVVFLLLIFFLVSSHLAQQELQMELDLPTASSGRQSDADKSRRLVINVLPPQGSVQQIMVGGQRMDQRQVAQLIRDEAMQLKQDPRPDRQQLEVRIRTDGANPYYLVEPIMKACADAGVWNITFAVVDR